MEENKIKKNPKLLSPLQLAFIGDGVYELLVRTYLIEFHDMNVNNLHKSAVKFVRADAQSQVVKYLEKEFSEEEMGIIKRGRNAKSGSTPKNAKLIDYKYATGLEALFGFLYLNNKKDRIDELFEKIVQFIMR